MRIWEVRAATAAVFVFLCGLGPTSIAFCDDHSTEIRAEAMRMSNALVKGDYRTVAECTFPSVVEMMGGKEKMIEVLRQGALQMQSQGTRYLSANIGAPDPVREINRKRYSLVPQIILIEVPQGVLVQESHLLAVSEDGGKQWRFVDTAPLADDEKLAVVFPDLVGKIKIPRRKQPVLTPK